MIPQKTSRPGSAQGKTPEREQRGRGAARAPAQIWRRADMCEQSKQSSDTNPNPPKGGGQQRDIARHTDNIALWGPQRLGSTPIVYSVMVEAPAVYVLKGWELFLEEGTEIVFPQHMEHEVRPLGHQEVRRNTTLRAWVATREIKAKVPKVTVQSQEQLQQEMRVLGWWKFWKLGAGDWMAARCRRLGTRHKDHFNWATFQLGRSRGEDYFGNLGSITGHQR